MPRSGRSRVCVHPPLVGDKYIRICRDSRKPRSGMSSLYPHVAARWGCGAATMYSDCRLCNGRSAKVVKAHSTHAAPADVAPRPATPSLAKIPPSRPHREHYLKRSPSGLLFHTLWCLPRTHQMGFVMTSPIWGPRQLAPRSPRSPHLCLRSMRILGAAEVQPMRRHWLSPIVGRELMSARPVRALCPVHRSSDQWTDADCSTTDGPTREAKLTGGKVLGLGHRD